MTKREEILFNQMVEAGRKAQVAEIEYIIAKRDYENAVDAYKLELQYQEEKKQEFIKNIEAFETVEERIKYVSDNQDDLLSLFFNDEEIEKYKKGLKGVDTDAG